jgi:hypothetical protein
MRTSLIIPASLILAGTLLAAYQTQAQSADKTITFFAKKSVVIDFRGAAARTRC